MHTDDAGLLVPIKAGRSRVCARLTWLSPAICAISARARVVQQEAAGGALTMTAPWVAGVYTAGWRPAAGEGTEAEVTPSV
jgi:hypothetical protein